MSEFLGDAKVFAIEFSSRQDLKQRSGPLQIWLGGKKIGTLDDTSVYSLVLAQLESIVSKNMDFYSEKTDIFGVYDLIKNGEIDDAGKYFLSLGDSFDDFSVVAFCSGAEVIFIWELLSEHFFEHDNYPEGLQTSAVPIKAFSAVLNEFREIKNFL
ncbi:hypothetical protein N8I74_18825 [Chitiniphilus purpureus]|uniref:Uncharacterized protein n=1 Tax=Chitiniphilus purpureus TaxID=2981137 RepID=A0ABY6DLU2_9NEIS|nr:hypothetical protein [Chitiniphilus sp. CD1]UXY15340.1 hypothetical protein N8I74_18825 [Chitiniphilus sp. CD1]